MTDVSQGPKPGFLRVFTCFYVLFTVWDPLGAIWVPNQAKGAQSRHFGSPGSILGAILRTLGTSLGVPSPTPGAPRWSPDAPEAPRSSAKRQRGDSNPCGQSPMDFESISLTARTHCHIHMGSRAWLYGPFGLEVHRQLPVTASGLTPLR